LIHETTSYLAKNYDVIVLEDLNVRSMFKNRAFAKHISDAAWGESARQLEYKTRWNGSTLVRVARFFPSSKTCSQCQAVRATLSIDERMSYCETCGFTIGRDLNAAINLAKCGLPGTNSGSGRGGEVRPVDFDCQAHLDEASTETMSDDVAEEKVRNGTGLPRG
jgi:putative transposase